MTRGQARLIRRNLTRLRDAIWKELIISYYTEVDQNYDRVLDIFVRANEGGTKLSKSDLLLSMLIARWGDVNARDEISGLVGHLNTSLTRKNDFDKDFVMKTCLVLSDLPVQYLVKNFNNANLSTIRSNWDDIKKAIAAGVDLVNSFGIDRDTLTSTNALIPVLYFLYKHPRLAPQHGSSAADVENASLIRRWVLMALLNNVFTGRSDTALAATRRVMQAYNDDSSSRLMEIGTELAKSGGWRSLTIRRSRISWIFAMASGKRFWRFRCSTTTTPGEGRLPSGPYLPAVALRRGASRRGGDTAGAARAVPHTWRTELAIWDCFGGEESRNPIGISRRR